VQHKTSSEGVHQNIYNLVKNSGGVVMRTFPCHSIYNQIILSVKYKVYINPGITYLFSGSTSGSNINTKFLTRGTVTDSIKFSSLFQG